METGNKVITTCDCTDGVYSPRCPYVFYNDGKPYHTLVTESKRAIHRGTTDRSADLPIPSGRRIKEEVEKISQMVESHQNLHDPFIYQDDGTDEYLDHRSDQVNPSENNRYVSGDRIKLGSGASMDKFRPLKLNGVSITNATIGGYSLDIKGLTRVAAEVVPLPPVALPRIFSDEDLNFYHHLFNGLEIFSGRDFITRHAETGTYSAGDTGVLSPLVNSLITTGYIEGEDELVVFIKRVFSVTFSVLESPASSTTGGKFLVKSNFYGFQYIEGGMVCREQDLKMWLHAAYTAYKLCWFNAFKSTGVPAFALKGVQDRYDSQGYAPAPEKGIGSDSLTRYPMTPSEREIKPTPRGMQELLGELASLRATSDSFVNTLNTSIEAGKSHRRKHHRKE